MREGSRMNRNRPTIIFSPFWVVIVLLAFRLVAIDFNSAICICRNYNETEANSQNWLFGRNDQSRFFWRGIAEMLGLNSISLSDIKCLYCNLSLAHFTIHLFYCGDAFFYFLQSNFKYKYLSIAWISAPVLRDTDRKESLMFRALGAASCTHALYGSNATYQTYGARSMKERTTISIHWVISLENNPLTSR